MKTRIKLKKLKALNKQLKNQGQLQIYSQPLLHGGNVPKKYNLHLRYLIYKLQWEFHKGDNDPQPSVPHGHCGQYRLSIWDGAVYKKQSGKLIKCGSVSAKELQKLKSDASFCKFVDECRKAYHERFPYYVAQADNRTIVRVLTCSIRYSS